MVTKAYAKDLKVSLFEKHSRTRKRIVVTPVAPLGLKRSARKTSWSKWQMRSG